MTKSKIQMSRAENKPCPWPDQGFEIAGFGRGAEGSDFKVLFSKAAIHTNNQ